MPSLISNKNLPVIPVSVSLLSLKSIGNKSSSGGGDLIMSSSSKSGGTLQALSKVGENSHLWCLINVSMSWKIEIKILEKQNK